MTAKGRHPGKILDRKLELYHVYTVRQFYCHEFRPQRGNEKHAARYRLFVSLLNGVSMELKSGHYTGVIITEEPCFIFIFCRMGG